MPTIGNSPDVHWLPATWPALPRIRAGITTRSPGYSRQAYAAFNLAHHVGDDKLAVQQNRRQLQTFLRLPAEPHWLNQAHGNRIVGVESPQTSRDADAAYTRTPGVVCALLTADCMPILVCNRDGTEVAAIHAGWRGLSANIIAKALACFASDPADLMAWIGPHISAANYTVRADVRNACINSLTDSIAATFYPSGQDTWQADLERLASMLLGTAGLTEIHASRLCTYAHPDLFYSYRREKITGRMATLIWIDQERIG